MPHGHKDYGGAAPVATVYTLQDMAELAARLGSIVTFDRRGNVIFLEDFQGSLSKVVTYTSGSGGRISISNKKSHFGDFSCEMVTGDQADQYAVVDKCLAYPTLSKIAIEVAWHLPGNHNSKKVNQVMYLYDGAEYWQADVYWDYLTKTWYYLNSDDVYVALSPTVAYREGSTLFHHTKLIADFVNKQYVQLIADNLTYDLTGKALRVLPAAVNAMLDCRFLVYAWEAGCGTAYLGGMIVTQNEP